MRLVDLFFAMRPLVLVPAWSFFLLGFGMARADLGAESRGFPLARFAALSLVLIGSYLVNQVVDYESDRLNGKGLFLQRGLFTRRSYVVLASVAILFGLAFSFWRREDPALLAAAAALGLAYSLPPLRLAARPGLDLVANALGYGGIALWLGADGAVHPSGTWLLRFGASTLAVAAVFLHTTLLDLEGDRRTGKRTSGVVFGEATCRRAALLFALAAGIAAGFARAPILLGATAIVTGLCILAALRPKRASSRSVCVAGTAAFAAAASVYVPFFLFAILLLAVVTRLYYRRRFALAYPAL
jgi:4-hydroxybenzoate polyprenyltransferase